MISAARFPELEGWVAQTGGTHRQARSCRDKAIAWLPEQGEAAKVGAPSMLPEPHQHEFASASSSASASASASLDR